MSVECNTRLPGLEVLRRCIRAIATLATPADASSKRGLAQETIGYLHKAHRAHALQLGVHVEELHHFALPNVVTLPMEYSTAQNVTYIAVLLGP
eukprot:2158953-Amphidinium_carterae.1